MKLHFFCGPLSATLLVLLLLLFLLQARTAVSIPTPVNVTTDASLPLAKRGCFLSKQDTDDLPVCTTLSVQYFNELIADYNFLPQRDCLFYLGLGGGKGQQLAKQWYCQKRSFGRGAVSWDTALPQKLHSDMFMKYAGKKGPKIGDPSQEDDFFTPTANDGSDPITNVWYQFEYPALTRDSAARSSPVLSILKVDPTLTDADGNFLDEGTVMWTPAHGPSPNAPLGDGYSFKIQAHCDGYKVIRPSQKELPRPACQGCNCECEEKDVIMCRWKEKGNTITSFPLV